MKRDAGIHPTTLLLTAVLATPLACMGEPSESEAELARSVETESTLELEIEHDGESLRASLSDGAAAVTIEMQKGEARPRDFIADPEIDSPHVFDLLVLDRNGVSLIAEFGGDRPLREDWMRYLVAPPERASLAERGEDLGLALELLDRISADEEAARAFGWEISGMRTTVEYVLDNVDFSGPTRLEPEPTPTPERELEVASPEPQPYAGSLYVHEIRIASASCCWPSYEHSAVQVNAYTIGGVWIGTIVTNNHGRSATDSSMSTESGCPRSWDERPNLYPPVQPYLATDTFASGNAGGCHTSYGIWSGSHVCNDDSYAQYMNTKYNVSGNWYGTCTDSTVRSTAPTCF